MRILIHGPGPWNPSGYGVQLALLARGLRDAGHDVTISAFGGFLREEPWEGIPLFACGASPYGVGMTRYNYHRAKADVMITVCDFWVLDPREWTGDENGPMTVAPWIPVDTTPLGELDTMTLIEAAKICNLRPVAMSKHGQAQLAERGIKTAMVPHAIRPCMTPGDRQAWRTLNHIPDDVFLISKVAVNQGVPDRKSFGTTLAAFQAFHERHPDARLYLHTLPQHKDGLDLYRMIRSLGLSTLVGFPDVQRRIADEHDDEWMASMHRATDVLDAATRGEGFGVPIIESLACGTPVIGSKCTSMPELIGPDVGWLCDVQPDWCNLHAAWWHLPLVQSLVTRYERAYKDAAKLRRAAATEGAKYHPSKVIPQWLRVLESLPTI